jgi:hypothetical protein
MRCNVSVGDKMFKVGQKVYIPHIERYGKIDGAYLSSGRDTFLYVVELDTGIWIEAHSTFVSMFVTHQDSLRAVEAGELVG